MTNGAASIRLQWGQDFYSKNEIEQTRKEDEQ